MSTEMLIASHLRLAYENLDAARLLLENRNRNSAYQCEQAVEQVILALAQSEAVHFERSQQHRLDTMAKMLPVDNPYRTKLLDVCWLEAYATTFRYPRTKGSIADQPPRTKLRAATKQVAGIIEDLAKYFGVDMSLSSNAPARNGKPPRRSSDLLD